MIMMMILLIILLLLTICNSFHIKYIRYINNNKLCSSSSSSSSGGGNEKMKQKDDELARANRISYLLNNAVKMIKFKSNTITTNSNIINQYYH